MKGPSLLCEPFRYILLKMRGNTSLLHTNAYQVMLSVITQTRDFTSMLNRRRDICRHDLDGPFSWKTFARDEQFMQVAIWCLAERKNREVCHSIARNINESRCSATTSVNEDAVMDIRLLNSTSELAPVFEDTEEAGRRGFLTN